MATVVLSDENRTPQLIETLRQLQQMGVEVGVFGDEESHLLMIARVHEFGMEIEVTERMRGYLHSQGLHLRADTEKITIPERSFMRSSWDQSQAELQELILRLLPAVLAGRLAPRYFYERIGIWLVARIQNQIREISDPPNHPFTVQRKGSSNPLVDTGRLIQSITYRVVNG